MHHPDRLLSHLFNQLSPNGDPVILYPGRFTYKFILNGDRLEIHEYDSMNNSFHLYHSMKHIPDTRELPVINVHMLLMILADIASESLGF